MNNSATQMYAVSLDQCVDAIVAYGDKRTILAQGHMGNGKSSMVTTRAERLTHHTPWSLDSTAKELASLIIRQRRVINRQVWQT